VTLDRFLYSAVRVLILGALGAALSLVTMLLWMIR
jgi:hypothetical protein